MIVAFNALNRPVTFVLRIFHSLSIIVNNFRTRADKIPYMCGKISLRVRKFVRTCMELNKYGISTNEIL